MVYMLTLGVGNQSLRFQQSDEIARRDLPKALEALGLLGRQLNIFFMPQILQKAECQVSLQNHISSNFHYDMFMVPIPSLMLFRDLSRFMCPQEAWLAAAWKSVTQRKNRLENSMEIL